MTAPQQQVEDDVLDAAKHHVMSLRRNVWDQIPEAGREAIAKELAAMVAGFKRCAVLVPELDLGEAAPAAMAAVGLYKGYECGRTALALALKEIIPELAPLAEGLVED
jgi:hypothetical protein